MSRTFQETFVSHLNSMIGMIFFQFYDNPSFGQKTPMSAFFGFCAATREPRELALPPYIVSHLNSMIDITVERRSRFSVSTMTACRGVSKRNTKGLKRLSEVPNDALSESIV
jgi:hypothetical protein